VTSRAAAASAAARTGTAMILARRDRMILVSCGQRETANAPKSSPPLLMMSAAGDSSRESDTAGSNFAYR